MLETGHSTTAGIHHYNRAGEKMTLTSDVLNEAEAESQIRRDPSSTGEVGRCSVHGGRQGH